MADGADFNRRMIEEFRAGGGQVGGAFAGSRLLLLHHRGARSGAERVSPLVYLPVDTGYAVFASKGGAPTNPGWYHNVRANPATTVEVGKDTVPVTARVADGEERDRIFAVQRREVPTFADYEAKTKGVREIPVVILERGAAS